MQPFPCHPRPGAPLGTLHCLPLSVAFHSNAHRTLLLSFQWHLIGLVWATQAMTEGSNGPASRHKDKVGLRQNGDHLPGNLRLERTSRSIWSIPPWQKDKMSQHHVQLNLKSDQRCELHHSLGSSFQWLPELLVEDFPLVPIWTPCRSNSCLSPFIFSI